MIVFNQRKKITQENCFLKQDSAREINFLILHHIEADSAEQAIEQLLEHKVSSHFLIAENGEIFQLVDENDIAYHAGVSFWNGCDGLNKSSIGIEILSKDAVNFGFSEIQMQSCLALCQNLQKKYQIKKRNILGHSDIAYSSENGFLDRKQDPSHLFNWKFLAENNVGIFPKIFLPENEDKMLFELGNKDSAIKEIKENLAKFGYKITNFTDEFDLEMQLLTRVFHRHFNQEKFNSDMDFWYLSSSLILDDLISNCQKLS